MSRASRHRSIDNRSTRKIHFLIPAEFTPEFIPEGEGDGEDDEGEPDDGKDDEQPKQKKKKLRSSDVDAR